MKFTTDGTRAHLIESIRSRSFTPGQVSKELFAIDGRLGLFVRVASHHKEGEVVAAYYNGGVRNFVVAKAVMEELAVANIEPIGMMDSASVEQKPAAASNVFTPSPDDHPNQMPIPGFFQADTNNVEAIDEKQG